jgi:hypothetical protein
LLFIYILFTDSVSSSENMTPSVGMVSEWVVRDINAGGTAQIWFPVITFSRRVWRNP